MEPRIQLCVFSISACYAFEVFDQPARVHARAPRLHHRQPVDTVHRQRPEVQHARRRRLFEKADLRREELMQQPDTRARVCPMRAERQERGARIRHAKLDQHRSRVQRKLPVLVAPLLRLLRVALDAAKTC
eukprot:6178046-Pleurochrysis_carterae.AAC.1